MVIPTVWLGDVCIINELAKVDFYSPAHVGDRDLIWPAFKGVFGHRQVAKLPKSQAQNCKLSPSKPIFDLPLYDRSSKVYVGMENNKTLNIRTSLLVLIVFVAALWRLVPHWPNFTPLAAMGLFGAAYFSRKWMALLIPFAALWISNLILDNAVYAHQYPEFYEGFVWFSAFSLWIYLAFGLVILLGWIALKKVNPGRLLVVSLTASLLFFLVTNAGSWLIDPLYPKNAAGLLAAYTAGIPYFWNTLAGDLFYTAVLFGSFEAVRHWQPNWLATPGSVR